MEDKDKRVTRVVSMDTMRSNIAKERKNRVAAFAFLGGLLLFTVLDAWLLGIGIGTPTLTIIMLIVNVALMAWLVYDIVKSVEDECIYKNILAMQFITMVKTEDGYILKFDCEGAEAQDRMYGEEDSDGT